MGTKTRGSKDARLGSVSDSAPSLRTRWPAEAPLEEDEFYDLLTNARRRAAISYLLRAGGPVSVSELVDHVAGREATGEPDQQLRKSIYVSLRQTHLPQLEQSGVVSFDPQTNHVEPDSSIRVFDDSAPVAFPRRPWAFVLLGILALAWVSGGLLGLYDPLERRVLLVALGYVGLIFVMGLWEVHRHRSATTY